MYAWSESRPKRLWRYREGNDLPMVATARPTMAYLASPEPAVRRYPAMEARKKIQSSASM